jgi:glycine/serine hydroxymethyltransferase
MTRYGMQESDFQRLADLIAEALKGRHVGEAVQALRREFSTLHYV